jgi:penicillin-binding protein 2
MSIGQGPLLASPLQVAQAMAGIANGGVLPRLQLVMQIQDSRGRVIKATVPERRNNLGVDLKAVEVVRAGMADVVSAGYGTGRSGALSYTELCGKTGTAQWNKARAQRLAWFAGFLPKDNPRYAFAVLYEGRPGETVSGGRMAAPMVRSFFEGIKKDIKDIIAPPQMALIVDEDEDVPDAATATANNPPRALPVEDENEADGGGRRPVEDPTPPAGDPVRPVPPGDDEVMDENQ